MDVADGVFCADQDVGTREKDHGLILGENFLDAIVEFFALAVAGHRKLLLHKAVNFGFPRCGWTSLRWVPKVRATAGEPDVEIGIGIGVETGESQKAGIVLLGLRDAID